MGGSLKRETPLFLANFPLYEGTPFYYVRAIFAVFSESPLTFFLAINILRLSL